MSKWKSTLIASWLAQVCSIMGFAFVMPFLPFYVRELGVTDEKSVLLWSGWLTTSCGITMAIVAPIWGVLADRHGRKLMVARSMIGGMLVITAMGFVQTPQQLLALRILQGILTGTVSASLALVSSAVPERRAGFALGLMQTAIFVGGAIGPWMGGAIAQHYGYRIPFFVAGGTLLIASLLTIFAVHEEFERPTANGADSALTLRDVLGMGGFTTMVTILFFVQLSGSFLGPILPLYIERISGLPPGGAAGTAGMIFGVSAIVAAVSATVVGRLSDRLGPRRVLVTCTFLTGWILIPHGLARTIGQLLACRLGDASVGAGTIPVANAIIRRIVPSEACGKAFGLVASVSCLGWGIGPIIGSSLAKDFGMRMPFFVVGGAFMLIAVATNFLLPRSATQLHETPGPLPQLACEAAGGGEVAVPCAAIAGLSDDESRSRCASCPSRNA